MDIWGRYNRQHRSCSYEPCTTPIERGERVICGRRKVKTATGVRTYNFVWHVDCWVAQLHEHLDSIPEEMRLPPRGRKIISDEPGVRAARLALLRRHASLNHRQLQCALRGDVEAVCSIEVDKQALIPLILETGPLPRKWRIG